MENKNRIGELFSDFSFLELVEFSSQENQLPSGKRLLTQSLLGDQGVWVYQAFSKETASTVLRYGNFLESPHFKLLRMSWLKPDFLSILHLSGMATKDGQETILAFLLDEDFFAFLLEKSFPSSISKRNSLTEKREVLFQWDPVRGPFGQKTKRKALQLGIRDNVLKLFSEGKPFKRIADVTLLARQNISSVEGKTFLVPKVKEFSVSSSIGLKLGISR